jgi:hypothetical protein
MFERTGYGRTHVCSGVTVRWGAPVEQTQVSSNADMSMSMFERTGYGKTHVCSGVTVRWGAMVEQT